MQLRDTSTPQQKAVAAGGNGASDDAEPSGLANWPVQLHLVPPQAPYLQQADVLLVADCVPFACADFHRRFLDGRPVVIGCPKLDDGQAYVQKLAQIILNKNVLHLGYRICQKRVDCVPICGNREAMGVRSDGRTNLTPLFVVMEHRFAANELVAVVSYKEE